jgi:hypothetical protein
VPRRRSGAGMPAVSGPRAAPRRVGEVVGRPACKGPARSSVWSGRAPGRGESGTAGRRGRRHRSPPPSPDGPSGAPGRPPHPAAPPTADGRGRRTPPVAPGPPGAAATGRMPRPRHGPARVRELGSLPATRSLRPPPRNARPTRSVRPAPEDRAPGARPGRRPPRSVPTRSGSPPEPRRPRPRDSQ